MTPYIQQRILCAFCGKYDRRLHEAPKTINCDNCGRPSELLQGCRGWGILDVPWFGKPIQATTDIGYDEELAIQHARGGRRGRAAAAGAYL